MSSYQAIRRWFANQIADFRSQVARRLVEIEADCLEMREIQQSGYDTLAARHEVLAGVVARLQLSVAALGLAVREQSGLAGEPGWEELEMEVRALVDGDESELARVLRELLPERPDEVHRQAE